MLIALPPLLSLLLAAGLLLSPNPGHAQGTTSMGVDLVTDGNSDTFVGSVESCLEVDVGDTFPVDVFIKDTQNLRAWELRFAFDHELLEIGTMEDHDFDQFLLSTDPSGSIFPSLFDEETDDRYFVAAAEFRGTPDSGSGVLVRLSMQAVAPGRSPVTIVTEPGFLAPRLTDIDSSALFEGPASQGEVAVGEPCYPSAPENPSTSDPTPSPSSGSTPTGDGDDDSHTSPPALVSLSDSPTRTLSGAGGGPSQASEAASSEASNEASGAIQVLADSTGEGSIDQVRVGIFRDNGSSGFGWRRVILAVAVIGIGAGSALMAFNLRNRL